MAGMPFLEVASEVGLDAGDMKAVTEVMHLVAGGIVHCHSRSVGHLVGSTQVVLPHSDLDWVRESTGCCVQGPEPRVAGWAIEPELTKNQTAVSDHVDRPLVRGSGTQAGEDPSVLGDVVGGVAYIHAMSRQPAAASFTRHASPGRAASTAGRIVADFAVGAYEPTPPYGPPEALLNLATVCKARLAPLDDVASKRALTRPTLAVPRPRRSDMLNARRQLTLQRRYLGTIVLCVMPNSGPVVSSDAWAALLSLAPRAKALSFDDGDDVNSTGRNRLIDVVRAAERVCPAIDTLVFPPFIPATDEHDQERSSEAPYLLKLVRAVYEAMEAWHACGTGLRRLDMMVHQFVETPNKSTLSLACAPAWRSLRGLA